jgi:penicillin amidase
VVYADRDGAIGAQAAGLVPVRRGWDGRLPPAGWSGEAEWTGWRMLDELPRTENPPQGFVTSANSSRARSERLRDVLSASGRQHSRDEAARLQHDIVAWNAGRLVPLLAEVRAERADVEQTRQQLLEWNREIASGAGEAALYVEWEQSLLRMLAEAHVPGMLVDDFIAGRSDALIEALTGPSRVWFAGTRREAARARDELALRALERAVDRVARGGVAAQPREVLFAHPLAITEAARARFNLGPFARGGYADTVMTLAGRPPDAAVGASFSAVFDVADWDRSVARQAPGQSESPESEHFANLAAMWAAGDFFPLAFSEAAVAASRRSVLTLVPLERAARRPEEDERR